MGRLLSVLKAKSILSAIVVLGILAVGIGVPTVVSATTKPVGIYPAAYPAVGGNGKPPRSVPRCAR